MRRLVFVIVIMTCLTSFYIEVDGKNKVILTQGSKSDTLFFGQTTADQILMKFGRVNVKTRVYGGKGELGRPRKTQKIIYDDLGLVFWLYYNTESKKLARGAKICYLSGIEVRAEKYCLDGICLGSSIKDVKDNVKDGRWGKSILMNPTIADSCCTYYIDSSYLTYTNFFLSFDVTKKPGKLVQINKFEIIE
jgi:hypothetical protein